MRTARRDMQNTTARRETRFKPRSINEEERTFEAVLATNTGIKRKIDGYVGVEVLEFRSGSIDTTRILGMSLLDNHRMDTTDAIRGRVEDYRIDYERGQLIIVARCADTEAGRAAFDLIRDGMISKVSIGYRRDRIEDETRKDGSWLARVTRWTPIEASLVCVPADHNAQIRAAKKGNTTMPKALRRGPAAQDDIDPDELDTIDELDDNEQRSQPRRPTIQVQRAIDAIRQRTIDAGVSRAEIDMAFENVRTADAASTAAFDLLAAKSSEIQTRPGYGRERRTDDNARASTVDALARAFGSSTEGVANNPLAGASIATILRSHMDANGVSTRMMNDAAVIDEAIHTRAWHTTSDSPLLFVEAGQRVLTERFAPLASVLKGVSRKRNARDFRPVNMIRPGGFPRHKKVLEDGEIKYGTFDIEGSVFAIESFAIAIGISRQMLVNDDLGAISDLLYSAAASAAEDEGDMLFAILSENGFGGRKLSDGKNFFHADHGNLAAAPAVPDITSMTAAREAMRLQKGVGGQGNAGAVPAVLLVGPKQETNAEKLVASLSAAVVSEVNPFAGKLRVAVENRYNGLGWWLFADPNVRPALVHGYLDGQIEGPRFRTDEPFGRQGMSFSSEFDFGCGVYDYRAAYFNPGA